MKKGGNGFRAVFAGTMRLFLSILLGSIMMLAAGPAPAQPGRGAEGPAAAELNRIFTFGDKCSMYGAPSGRPDRPGGI